MDNKLKEISKLNFVLECCLVSNETKNHLNWFIVINNTKYNLETLLSLELVELRTVLFERKDKQALNKDVYEYFNEAIVSILKDRNDSVAYLGVVFYDKQ